MNDFNDRLIFIFHLSAKMGGFMIINRTVLNEY